MTSVPPQRLLTDALITGSVASLASTAVLSACGHREGGDPYAPTNATSQWIWGKRSICADGASLRYTLPGFLIHHASSIFWAAVYAKWRMRHKVPQASVDLALGAAVAGLACLVDLRLTPERLRPGFEKKLSKGSLALVYGAFGLGLAGAARMFKRG